MVESVYRRSPGGGGRAAHGGARRSGIGASIRLGSIFGIPIGINYTWFIIFLLVAFSLAVGEFPSRYPLWTVQQHWTLGVITSLLLFASVLFHELSHSVLALRFGIPVRSITLFVFGGISQIARDASTPGREVAIAIAGPLSSFVLAGLFWLLQWGIGQPAPASGVEMVKALASWLAFINVALGLFNMVPGFPLDGGRVFRGIVWGITGNQRRATRVAAATGRAVAYAMILFGIINVFQGNLVGGIWIAFIGWFLENAATSTVRQAELRETLQGYTASQVMSREVPRVGPSLTLKELVDQHILFTGRRAFLVCTGDTLEGIITIHNVRQVPPEARESTLVAQAMTPAERVQAVSPLESAYRVLEVMDETDVSQVPVVDGSRVVGLIGRDGLLHLIRIRSELDAS